MISTEELGIFCKKKGFVYPSSEIYGGMKGFFDLGPKGVELFNNIKQSWWKFFVQDRDNIVGMDGSVISNPKVWKASGHLDNFGDMVLACSKCNNKLRADHFIEDKLNKNVEGMKASEINNIIKKNELKCPECKGDFKELKNFNLLFKTNVGADEEQTAQAFLRGETAQGMFVNFKLIVETNRVKLPFGIAQIGKCFRNEIAPRDFMFRSREFTIGELEFFILPEEKKCLDLSKEQKDLKVMFLSAEKQEEEKEQEEKKEQEEEKEQEDKEDLEEKSIGEIVKEGKLDEWHAYWLAEQMRWFYSIGLKKENLKVREHMKKELSHYSTTTYDIDFKYPFGSKEIAGNANRGQYDLKQHAEHSKKSMEIFDEESKSKIIPRVIEPTFGMERVFLAVISQAYEDDKERGNVVLKIDPKVAPIKVGVFPLIKKLDEKGKEVYNQLKECFACTYDYSGSIGRRYSRIDELGVPLGVTIDFESLEDESVTLRDRDTTKQVRIKISNLKNEIFKIIHKSDYSIFKN